MNQKADSGATMSNARSSTKPSVKSHAQVQPCLGSLAYDLGIHGLLSSFVLLATASLLPTSEGSAQSVCCAGGCLGLFDRGR
jgi:hypothetical protein